MKRKMKVQEEDSEKSGNEQHVENMEYIKPKVKSGKKVKKCKVQVSDTEPGADLSVEYLSSSVEEVVVKKKKLKKKMKKCKRKMSSEETDSDTDSESRYKKPKYRKKKCKDKTVQPPSYTQGVPQGLPQPVGVGAPGVDVPE